VSGSLLNSSAVMALLAIPGSVIWSYFGGAVVLAIGLVTLFLRGDWQKAREFDKLILFGPLFFAAPIAAFGTEHFTVSEAIASIIPAWIPWHHFWAYFVGGCFIAAALSIVTKVQVRVSASLLALTFFLFVVLIHAPNWAQDPRNRFALAVALRELSFSGGALALTASLTGQWRDRGTHISATIARYLVAIPVLFFSFEQFMHGNYVPGIPLNRMTPEWIYGHIIWTYLAAVIYAVAGILLLVGKKLAQQRPAGLDRALRGVGGLRADRSSGSRQPQQWPEFRRGYADVLRRSSSARGRHAARSLAGRTSTLDASFRLLTVVSNKYKRARFGSSPCSMPVQKWSHVYRAVLLRSQSQRHHQLHPSSPRPALHSLAPTERS
jgi:uncharacterized membrane protein